MWMMWYESVWKNTQKIIVDMYNSIWFIAQQNALEEGLGKRLLFVKHFCRQEKQLVRPFSNYQWQCRYETSRWYLKSRKESKITVKVSFKLWYFLHFLINQQLSGKSKAWSKQGIIFYQPRKILVFLVSTKTN